MEQAEETDGEQSCSDAVRMGEDAFGSHESVTLGITASGIRESLNGNEYHTWVIGDHSH